MQIFIACLIVKWANFVQVINANNHSTASILMHVSVVYFNVSTKQASSRNFASMSAKQECSPNSP